MKSLISLALLLVSTPVLADKVKCTGKYTYKNADGYMASSPVVSAEAEVPRGWDNVKALTLNFDSAYKADINVSLIVEAEKSLYYLDGRYALSIYPVISNSGVRVAAVSVVSLPLVPSLHLASEQVVLMNKALYTEVNITNPLALGPQAIAPLTPRSFQMQCWLSEKAWQF